MKLYLDQRTALLLELISDGGTLVLLHRLAEGDLNTRDLAKLAGVSPARGSEILEKLLAFNIVDRERYLPRRGKPGYRWSLRAERELEELTEFLTGWLSKVSMGRSE